MAEIVIYKVTEVTCSKVEALIQAGISRDCVAESAARVAKGGALVDEAAAKAAEPIARFLANKAVAWVRRVNEEGKMEEMAHFAPSEPFPEIHSNFGAIEMTVASLEQGAEIAERQQFLEHMRAMGKGEEHEAPIRLQVAERMGELGTLERMMRED